MDGKADERNTSTYAEVMADEEQHVRERSELRSLRLLS